MVDYVLSRQTDLLQLNNMSEVKKDYLGGLIGAHVPSCIGVLIPSWIGVASKSNMYAHETCDREIGRLS